MRASFKIKSKSLPFFRQRLYDKISTKFKSQKWQEFLQREFQLGLAIRELSKAEFDISNQNQHKYSVRQNFQIKKDIIKCLQEEDIQNSLLKLQKLRLKMKQFNQEKGVQSMINFLECRNIIKKDIKNGKEELIIADIKSRIGDSLFDNQNFMVKIKTMSILSILLLRFHGILMTSEQRTIIFKTIDLKKKKMLHIDQKEDRQSQFQCLIYILSQLYKIIYLLKLDQQTLHHYYNQLHAYSQILIEKKQNTNLIEVQELLKILSDMKPLINDLNIYEDSKIKRQLAFEHIVQEIVEKDQKPDRKILVDQRLSTSSFRKSLEMSINSSGKFSNSSKLKIENSRRKLTLKRTTVQTLSHPSSVKDQYELINILTKKGIHYSFIFPINQKYYIVFLNFSFRNGFALIDFDLTLQSEFAQIQKYQLRGICNALQKMTVDGIGKLFEKICLKIFGSTAQFKQIHNLIIAEKYVPGQYEAIIFALIRGKAVIKQYMRSHFQQEYITSKKIIYPQITASELNGFLQIEFKDEEGKRMRNTLQKRRGIFHRDQPLGKLPQMVFLKMIVKKQIEKHCEYFLLNGYYFQYYFKGLDIFCLKEQTQPPQLVPYINKMKQISQNAYVRQAVIRPSTAILSLLLLQNKQPQYSEKMINYRIDQELQLPTSNISNNVIQIKTYNKLKRTTRKNKEKPIYQVLRTRNHQYQLFYKQNHGNYMRYSNDRHIINIPQEIIAQELSIEKKRIRMYNTITISKISKGPTSIKSSIKKGIVVASKQVITLTFSRHMIVKKDKGFMIVIEYNCPSQEYLYEFVLNTINRFYSFLRQKIVNLNWSQIDWNNMKFKGSPLHCYKGQRKQISEANYFYSCMKQQFPRSYSQAQSLQQNQDIP